MVTKTLGYIQAVITRWLGPARSRMGGLAGVALALTLASSAAADDPYEQGQIVIKLNPGHTIDEVNGNWGTTTVDAFPEGNLYLLDAAGLGDVEDLADEMTDDPAVLEAEANYFQDTPEGIRQMLVLAIGGSYVDFEDQEITERIGLDLAHEHSNGFGVTIALLDSGVDPEHQALLGRLAPDGYDFVDGDSSPWEEFNGSDDDGDGISDEGYGHGTMVAGILALVAPGATILPVRVLDDEGRGDAYEIAKGIRYALNHGADVINCSFGVPRHISIIAHELEYAVETSGVPVIAGAGNENRENPAYYPAEDGDAVMVTALDSLDVKADFADFNGKVLVSSPGTGVRSSFPGGGWALGAGCSFAVPFVTGEAALILGRAPHLTPEEIENWIENAVDPIQQHPGNDPYQDRLGSGRIYLPAAVDGFPTAGVDTTVPETTLRAYPNPASGPVRFWLPNGIDVAAVSENPLSVSIVDPAGRRLAVPFLAGNELVWDGRTSSGDRVAPGVYFVSIRQGTRILRTSVRVLR